MKCVTHPLPSSTEGAEHSATVGHSDCLFLSFDRLQVFRVNEGHQTCILKGFRYLCFRFPGCVFMRVCTWVCTCMCVWEREENVNWDSNPGLSASKTHALSLFQSISLTSNKTYSFNKYFWLLSKITKQSWRLTYIKAYLRGQVMFLSSLYVLSHLILTTII